MPISDGENVKALNINRAKLDREGDDTATGIITLANLAPASGAQIDNLQKAVNDAGAAGGGTNYSSNTVINDLDDHETALGDLDERFSGTTGHKHTGVDGEGQPVDGEDIAGVPLQGEFKEGSPLVGTAGLSKIVTGEFAAATPSLDTTTKGVVVNPTNNEVFLLQETGVNTNDVFRDLLGNIVFGRLTEAAGVWTLTFFTDVEGVETAFTFTGQNIRWFYQELFERLVDTPVYSTLWDILGDRFGGEAAVVFTGRAGTLSVSSGVNTRAVTFSSDIGTALYAVRAMLVNKTDAGPQIQETVITAKTSAGFTAEWPANTDSANYELCFIASLHSDGGGGEARAGSEALGSGVNSKAVVFSSDIGTVAYAVIPQLVNIVDGAPQIQTPIAIVKTTSGFTATWPANTDSANYVLDYQVSALTNTIGRQATEAIGNGVNTKNSSFADIGSILYAGIVSLNNIVDGAPQIQALTMSVKATDNFTEDWPANTDSANYILDYIIREHQ